jgi:hypothetical protein
VSVAARGAGGDDLFFCLVVDGLCMWVMLKTDLNVVGGELPPACIDKVFNAEASPVGMAGSNDRGVEGSASYAPLNDNVKRSPPAGRLAALALRRCCGR